MFAAKTLKVYVYCESNQLQPPPPPQLTNMFEKLNTTPTPVEMIGQMSNYLEKVLEV